MRISLLLEREPFPEILERTLGNFWSQAYGRPVCLKWHRSFSSRIPIDSGVQIWYVNGYLNSIFIPRANAPIFEPIRAEFSHSLAFWRRPLQKAYVHAALTWPASLFLSQASLNVRPVIPNAENILIIAGNQKIRLVDAARGESTAILKKGFRPYFFERELGSRSRAARLGLPVPELMQVAEDRSWFTEERISGTPLNRLEDNSQAQLGTRLALGELQRFVEEYSLSVPVSDYADSLSDRINQQIKNIHLLDAGQEDNLLITARELHREATMSMSTESGHIMLSTVHGDFQAANILFEDGRVWIVDWEYSDQRQSVYDLLTLFCSSRHPEGLAERLRRFEKNPATLGPEIPENWPGLDISSAEKRHRMISLFLLEELLLHLCENANPLFRQLGKGLEQIQTESLRWLNKT